MSRTTGAVRFEDGQLLYFVYSSMVGVAAPALFGSPEDAFASWDGGGAGEPLKQGIGGTDEPVEVMPYFQHGNAAVMFRSRANRASKWITGPLSADAAEMLELPSNTNQR